LQHLQILLFPNGIIPTWQSPNIVKFANGTIMLNIPKIFQAKSTLQSDRRDIMDDVIVPSLLLTSSLPWTNIYISVIAMVQLVASDGHVRHDYCGSLPIRNFAMGIFKPSQSES
jgi:hypothetical protein